MLAAAFDSHGDPSVIRLQELPDPSPGPGEVRIRVRAASLNHLDLWVRRGLPIKLNMPHVGGCDIAGTVDQLGDGAPRWWLGRRVVADPSLSYEWYDLARSTLSRPFSYRVIGEHTRGGFAHYATVPVDNLVEIPEGVSFGIAAAAALTGVTAWRGLVCRGALRPGERVLVTGASGGVSSVAIQYAKHAGARVFAITSTPYVDKVRELGADHVFDRHAFDWGKEIHRITDKKGIDLCLDSVGEAIWPDLVRSLSVGGRLVSFGATTGPKAVTDLRVLFWRQLTVMGATMGSAADFRNAMQLVFDGVIKPPVQRVFPLAGVRRAHEMLEAGSVFGKLLVEPWEG